MPNICSFPLMEKNQKIKAVNARLTGRAGLTNCE